MGWSRTERRDDGSSVDRPNCHVRIVHIVGCPMRNRTLTLPWLACCLLAPLLIAVALEPSPARAAPTKIQRIAGSNRYETAVQVSRNRNYFGSRAVYLSTGTNFADALAAGPLADRGSGPILLTPRDSLPQIVADEITRLDAEEIVILGGTNAVSTAVETRVSQISRATVRRISGANRYDTAVEISKDAFPAGAPAVYLATGENFADALAAGPIASVDQSPILLTLRDSIPQSVKDEIRRLQPKEIVILGGLAAVSAAVEADLSGLTNASVRRVAGSNRYETAVELSRNRLTAPQFFLHLSTGENFADALAAAATSWPVLMSPKACLPDSVLEEILRLGVDQVFILGGESALSRSVASLITCSGDTPIDEGSQTNDVRALLDPFAPTATFLGEDRTAVVICRVPANSTHGDYREAGRVSVTAQMVTDYANRYATPYFRKISGGRYWPTFTALSTIDLTASEGREDCASRSKSITSGSFTNVLAVDTSGRSDGRGSTGSIRTGSQRMIAPPSDTGRGYIIGGGGFDPLFPSMGLFLIAHENGHTLLWNHSHLSPSDEYDNPLDLMSDGHGCAFFDIYSEVPCPVFNTIALNRFMAGWIDPSLVTIHRKGRSSTVLSARPDEGQQMLVAMHPWRPEIFLTFEARTNGTVEQGLPHEGVAIHFVDQSADNCFFGATGGCQILSRRQGQALGASDTFEHLVRPGSPTIRIEGLSITITQDAAGFRVTLDGTYQG